MLLMKLNFTRVVYLIGIVCLIGCTSPLKSNNRLTRLEAVEKVSSQDDLFFIAMNVGFETPSKKESALTQRTSVHLNMFINLNAEFISKF